MDYSYYTANQGPYQFLEFGQEPNGSVQNGHANGFVQPNTHFQSPYESIDRQPIYDSGAVGQPPLEPQGSIHSLHRSPAPSISPPESMVQNGQRASFSEANVNDTFAQALPDGGDDLMNRTRSSSEEKDSMTPAQTKRKAQNRAAQRAFRERKERHVKDLEVKLAEMEDSLRSLRRENEVHKQEIAKISTENQILKATSQLVQPQHVHPTGPPRRRDEDMIVATGPMTYHPQDQVESSSSTATSADKGSSPASASLSASSPPSTLSPTSASQPTVKPPTNRHASLDEYINFALPAAYRVTISPATGQRLLSAGAVWEYIQASSLFRDGLVEIEDVSKRLQGKAQCDGNGPAFEEMVIQTALEQSREARERECEDMDLAGPDGRGGAKEERVGISERGEGNGVVQRQGPRDGKWESMNLD